MQMGMTYQTLCRTVCRLSTNFIYIYTAAFMVMTSCSVVDIHVSEGDTSFIFGVKVSEVVKWQVVYKIWGRKLGHEWY